MKILVLENIPSSKRGGQELSLLDVCQGLAAKGHEIHLAYLEIGDLLEKYQTFCKSITQVQNYTIDGSSMIFSGLQWFHSKHKLSKIKADIIYANQYHDTLFGGSVARSKNIPLVCHLRLFPPGIFCGQWSLGMRNVTHFIAISKEQQNAYQRVGIKRETISLVYNGIDLNRFGLLDDRSVTRKSMNISPDDFVVIYAGRIDHDKNLELLIHGFKKFETSNPHARLLIAGAPLNETGKKYQNKLESASDRIQWLGHRSDLPKLFRASDATVLVSKVKEGFGRVLVESMACGTPAIGILRGGIPEILSGEFQKFGIKNNDPSELAAALQLTCDTLKKDPDLRNRCHAHIQKNFKKEQMVDGVENVLEQALRKESFRLGPSYRKLRAWREPSPKQDFKRICLISSIPLWTNPRLIREADLFTSLGYSVAAVTVIKTRDSYERDLELLKSKKWTAFHVNLIRDEWPSTVRWFITALRSRFCSYFPEAARFREEGYFRGFSEVLQKAIQCQADLYIAHTQAALPIAARAAKHNGTIFGFDCEDLLAEETADGLRSLDIREAIVQIEKEYLPQAAYITVASHAMGEYLTQQYGIHPPTVLRNVFPQLDAKDVLAPNQRPPSTPLKLVWISVTIGEGRGIEDAVRALSLLPRSCELHLFGKLIPSYGEKLNDMAFSLNVGPQLFIHETIPHDQIFKIISTFDIGLALEQKACINRNLTITNKLFFYLQSGLAVAATNTKGQREIMEKIPNVGFLYPSGDYRSLAKELERYLKDPGLLLKTKINAWEAGTQTYCWDQEQNQFLQALEKATSHKFKQTRPS